MAEYPQLVGFDIDGYRPFREFSATFGSLEVIVGANGAGKSSLFEFLRVLRDGMDRPFPPGLVSGGSIRRLYHNPEKEKIDWGVRIAFPMFGRLDYTGVLTGPYGQFVASEYIHHATLNNSYLSIELGIGRLAEAGTKYSSEFSLKHSDRLALGLVVQPFMTTLLGVQEYIRSWHFYNSFNLASNAIRSPVITEQNPTLREDASNLSDVLQYLKNEHESAFAELNRYMRLFVPGFQEVKVKSYGAPGQVMAFWREEGVDQELSLADLSDGIFRLLCWTVLCVDPNPPSLICIDEPDQGVHPRTLPILADLFKQASRRTQVILATHSSYFLSQFDLSQIAVMRKEDGRAVYVKPATSKALVGMLEDFGAGEIEILHRSEELERLP